MFARSRRRVLASAVSLVVAGSVTGLTAMGPAAAATGAHHPHGASWYPRAMAKLDPSLRPLARHPHGNAGIIVTGGRSHEGQIKGLGGHVTHDLSIIDGFSAVVPQSKLLRIAAMSGVRSVTRDTSTAVSSVAAPQDAGNGPYDLTPSVYRQVIGADQLAAQGANGHGVTVALIDTGVTPMGDIANALVSVQTGLTSTAPCMNFTDDPDCTDHYGHGTFLAGLIAGNGSASNGRYTGVAPGARILSVKIAGASGASDVSTIIAALEAVVATKNIYGTKVVNLSLGTDGTQSYLLDPLDYAVEQAWRAGLVVNVAASNLGPNPMTIDDPADDPYVITVGAVCDQGTTTTADDIVPTFSSRGPTKADGLAKPDVTAPGCHLVSLAAPGAAVTQEFPPNMPAPYRRGSGTSMSTAVVSGLVADLLSAEPTASPDRVKYQLMAGAQPDASTDPMAVGAGLVNGPAALAAGPGLANQGLAPSAGTGSLQAARGSVTVTADDTNGTTISGNVTLQLQVWNPVADLLSSVLWTPLSGNWYSGNWYSGNWYSGNWYSGNWYSGNWYSGNWYSGNWYSGNWYSGNWYSGNWYGSAWYGCWDY